MNCIVRLVGSFFLFCLEMIGLVGLILFCLLCELSYWGVLFMGFERVCGCSLIFFYFNFICR